MMPYSESELTELKKKIGIDSNNCFIYDDKAILYGTISLSNIDSTVSILQELYNKGLNVTPIYDYILDKDSSIQTLDFEKFQNGWVVEKKARGKHLYKDMDIVPFRKTDSDIEVVSKYYESLREYIKALVYTSKIKQEDYDNLASLYYEIYKSNLAFDPTNNHLFYEEGIGFTIVGLHYEESTNNSRGLFISDLINMLLYQSCYISCVNNEYIDDIPAELYDSLKSSVNTILDKIMLALYKLPIRRSRVDSLLMDYLNTKKSLFNGGISSDELLCLLNKSVNNGTIAVNNIK